MAAHIVGVIPTFCREIASLELRMWVVGARSVVRTLQFNGKQEGRKGIYILVDLTCAAPATVSERIKGDLKRFAFRFHLSH
jgi:hypothetical protein